MTTLTTADITAAELFDRMEDNPAYAGHGYLNGRNLARDASDPEVTPKTDAFVAIIDAHVVEYAEAHGWTQPQLFAWANSRIGRWFADLAFNGPHGDNVDDIIAAAVHWNLLVRVGT